MRESEIQSKCTEYLRGRGIYYKKIVLANSGGTPDIFACIGGKFVAFEIKSEKGKPTELQLYNQRKIRECGGHCYIVYSYKQFKETVDEIIKRESDRP